MEKQTHPSLDKFCSYPFYFQENAHNPKVLFLPLCFSLFPLMVRFQQGSIQRPTFSSLSLQKHQSGNHGFSEDAGDQHDRQQIYPLRPTTPGTA